MHCSACGVEVTPEAIFCHKCGQRLDAAGGDYSDQESDARQMFEQGVADRGRGGNEVEEHLWEGRYSPKAMIGAWILTALATLALVVGGIFLDHYPWVWLGIGIVAALLWIFQAGKLAYRRMNVVYRLTNQRLIHESGIFRRVTDRIETIDMDDITFEQSFIERFMGVGTVKISSSDRTHPELRLVGIEDVKRVADQMDDIRRAERRRRGLHIESI